MKVFKSGGSVPVEEFIQWTFTEKWGTAIVSKFQGMFKELNVLEHYNNSYKLKVSRDDYSIGYLFGMMEDIKDEF